MKNSKDYAGKIQTHYRSLKRKFSKVEKVEYDEVLDSLIYGIISEKMTQEEALSAYERFEKDFVDLNDLRVSLIAEIMEMIGKEGPEFKETAQRILNVLKVVFETYNTVSLNELFNMGKRPAKQKLEKIEGVTKFSVDYCFLTSLGGHVIPLTETMVNYLKENDLVHPDADVADIEGFLSRQITAKNGYEFYILLRQKSETYKPKVRVKKKAVITKKTVEAKKTTKKVKKTTKRAKKAKTKVKEKKVKKTKKTKG